MIKIEVLQDVTLVIDQHQGSYQKGDVFEIHEYQLPEYAPYIAHGIFAIKNEKIINKKQKEEVMNNDN